MRDERYEGFPEWFFSRADEAPDDAFYAPPRLVHHIDEAAIAAVGDLYDELGLAGGGRRGRPPPEEPPLAAATNGAGGAGGGRHNVLDLCSSWVSHFHAAPARLVALGMNEVELARNPQATEWLVHDLNADPRLPFADASFDAATCCVSVDYLARPIEVFDDVARVLRPDALFVCTFSNRLFPTKAIRGWLAGDDDAHLATVQEYFRRSRGWGEPVAQRRTPLERGGDPLFAVWAPRTS